MGPKLEILSEIKPPLAFLYAWYFTKYFFNDHTMDYVRQMKLMKEIWHDDETKVAAKYALFVPN